MSNYLAEYLFHEGTNFHSYEFLGSFLSEEGCTFRVWAPNASKVFVTGEFCDWNPKLYEMKKMSDQGIFEVTILGLKAFDTYKYVIETPEKKLLWKADPYAKHAETRPHTASKIYNMPNYQWRDQKWMKERQIPYNQPMNIYEVHLGSWKHHENHTLLSYQELAVELVSYVKK